MKIKFAKDMAKEHARGRKRVDEYYMRQIANVLGFKVDLYTVKYTMAQAHLDGNPSDLIIDDEDARQIIDRHHASLSNIAALEKQRQALQARVDACKTAAEVDALLERVFNTKMDGS